MISQMQKIYNEVVWSWVAQKLADARQPTMRLNIFFLILLKGSLPTFDIIGQEKENTHSQKEEDCTVFHSASLHLFFSCSLSS